MTVRRLTCLLLSVLAAAALLAPATSAASAQNRVRAFSLAALTDVGRSAAESPWTRPVSNVSTARIAAGCCVAAKGGGALDRLAVRLADETGAIG